MVIKSIQIGLHALFLNEKVLTVHNVLIGVVITPEVFLIEASCLQFGNGKLIVF